MNEATDDHPQRHAWGVWLVILGTLLNFAALAVTVLIFHRSEVTRLQDVAAVDAALLREQQGGDIGRGEALSREWATDRYLDNLDLSCKAIGETAPLADGTPYCSDNPVLRNLSRPVEEAWFPAMFRSEATRFALPRNLSLAENQIFNAFVPNSDAAGIDLYRAHVADSDFTGAIWSGRFSGATFRDSRFVNAQLIPEVTVNYVYLGGDVSNLIVGGELHCWVFIDAYAWADAPPRQDPDNILLEMKQVGVESISDSFESSGGWAWWDDREGSSPYCEAQGFGYTQFDDAANDLIYSNKHPPLDPSAREFFPPLPLSVFYSPVPFRGGRGLQLCKPIDRPLSQRPRLSKSNCTPVDPDLVWTDIWNKQLERTDLTPNERMLIEAWGELRWTGIEREAHFRLGPLNRDANIYRRGWGSDSGCKCGHKEQSADATGAE